MSYTTIGLWVVAQGLRRTVTSNQHRLEDCLLHRAAGNEVSIVQHVSRQPLKLVPDEWAQRSHCVLEPIIGSVWWAVLYDVAEQTRCGSC